MSKKKARTKAPRVAMPKITADEVEQMRIRRAQGLPLGHDEYGRDRLPSNTAESHRRYDRSATGIVRLRTADPLKELKLSERQRNAGLRFRADYELASRSGIKPASMQPRVDSSGMPQGAPPAVLGACRSIGLANQALGHREIQMVVEHVCGLRESIREIANRTRDPRPALAKLLTIGLDKLADMYFGPVKVNFRTA